VVDSAGVRRIELGGSYVRVRRMEQLFGGDDSNPGRGPMLVLRVGDQRVTLEVDAVVGQEEIVVKNLGELLAGHPLFAGVTIRGTGELVLILDVPALIESKVARDTTADATTTSAALVPPLLASPVAPFAAAAPREAARRRKVRVMFVDDSLSVRKVAEKTLLGLGAEVTLAVDGVDALAKLREIEVDIVFTDLEMPRMHGYDLIRELRFLPAHKDLPIVVVSSRSGQKHQQQARGLGASDYITKPFSQQTIEGTLKRFCADGRSPAQGRDVREST
jgi:chemosensory pili system protein ChpA (sensor histidine kinase/response regulator)